mmetsp:Transcript_7813/g.9478  ORF Transcript_7813/g.9478 Transcript_7813/m.9478 type:complete len:144 (-) Transcript_7813:13-444(-)
MSADRKLVSIDAYITGPLSWLDDYAKRGFRPSSDTDLKTKARRLNDDYTASVYTKGIHLSRVGAFCSGVAAFWVLGMFATTALVFPDKTSLLLGLIRIVLAFPFSWTSYVTLDPLLFCTERIEFFWKAAWRTIHKEKQSSSML